MTSPLVECVDLHKRFQVDDGAQVHAVVGVNLTIDRGETLAVVGESGCGKSTLANTVIRLEEPDDGQVFLDGVDISHLKRKQLREHRRKMQIIFQDPHASLNPRMTVGTIVGEPLREHGVPDGGTIQDAVDELLTLVGLDPSHANRYPHEFSGGQRQRIGIARAIALSPDFIVCDEAIAALDVSIQAQVVNLLLELQERLGLTYLFISHDLSMVRHIADRIAVMYLGKIVELADVHELHTNARHPYTQALHSAVPVPDPVAEQLRERVVLQVDIPSPSNPPSGCVFRTRCPRVEAKCASEVPVWTEAAPNHWVACHFPD